MLPTGTGSTGFTVSSLSSQFLEGDKLFWGAVPFHIGLLAVFFGHLLAFLLPSATLAWNSVSCSADRSRGQRLRLRSEPSVRSVEPAMAAADQPHAWRMVTSRMDIVIEVLLLAQVSSRMLGGARVSLGVLLVRGRPHTLSVVASCAQAPRPDAVFALPWVIRLHIVGAFLDPLHGSVHASRAFHRRAAALHRPALSGGHVELGSQGRSKSERAVEQGTPEEQLAVHGP